MTERWRATARLFCQRRDEHRIHVPSTKHSATEPYDRHTIAFDNHDSAWKVADCEISIRPYDSLSSRSNWEHAISMPDTCGLSDVGARRTIAAPCGANAPV
ncbi:hypothetical protein GCM10009691_10530 [Brevibacterium picturae]|uniref:Uncharacterized protein n=1 Tax=Brevibacterium picturae TaxID=260553 RepID=A0ABN2BCQ2_9MICO